VKYRAVRQSAATQDLSLSMGITTTEVCALHHC
jgi:hypothetical protein